MHFSAPNPIIKVETTFEGIDHLATESEFLTMKDAEIFLRSICVSLKPFVDTLYSAQNLAII